MLVELHSKQIEQNEAALLIAYHLALAAALYEASDIPEVALYRAITRQFGYEDLHGNPARVWVREIRAQYARTELDNFPNSPR